MTEQPAESILRRVALLIQKAESANITDAERDAYLAKADEMMFRHAIDQAMLAKFNPSQKRDPVGERLVFCQRWERYDAWLMQTLEAVARTNRCRVAVPADGGIVDGNQEVVLVGFEDDVHFVQLLWTSIHLTFVQRIHPRWEQGRSQGENVRALKEAGWKWEKIAAAGGITYPGPQCMTIYKAQCRKDGVEPMATQRFAAYRDSFAYGFTTTVQRRLREQERRREGQTVQYQKDHGLSSGMELVLSDRMSEVDRLLYELFPNLDPEKVRAAARKAQEEHEAWYAGLTDKQRAEYDRKQKAAYERSLKANGRYWDRMSDDAGRYAGRRAGDQVDLSGGRDRLSNNTRQLEG